MSVPATASRSPSSHDRAASMGRALRVLSVNVWGVPVSMDRPKRMRAFCHHLRVPNQYDVVGIQEAFIESDRRAIIASGAAGGLPYSHYFYSGMGFPLGGEPSGMLLLSRYPIVAVAYHRFSLNGRAHNLLHWDYQCGKGVGLARIDTGAAAGASADSGMVDVYVSHLIASYTTSSTERDEYRVHRVAQAYEAAEFISATRRSDLALLLCDMNATSDSLVYALLRVCGAMRDAFRVANPTLEGHTCGVNEYDGSYPLSSKRIDFVLYSVQPHRPAVGSPPPTPMAAVGNSNAVALANALAAAQTASASASASGSGSGANTSPSGSPLSAEALDQKHLSLPLTPPARTRAHLQLPQTPTNAMVSACAAAASVPVWQLQRCDIALHQPLTYEPAPLPSDDPSTGPGASASANGSGNGNAKASNCTPASAATAATVGMTAGMAAGMTDTKAITHYFYSDHHALRAEFAFAPRSVASARASGDGCANGAGCDGDGGCAADAANEPALPLSAGPNGTASGQSHRSAPTAAAAMAGATTATATATTGIAPGSLDADQRRTLSATRVHLEDGIAEVRALALVHRTRFHYAAAALCALLLLVGSLMIPPALAPHSAAASAAIAGAGANAEGAAASVSAAVASASAALSALRGSSGSAGAHVYAYTALLCVCVPVLGCYVLIEWLLAVPYANEELSALRQLFGAVDIRLNAAAATAAAAAAATATTAAACDGVQPLSSTQQRTPHTNGRLSA